MPRFAFFTDLDGTLLDHETYSFEAARPALERAVAAGHIVSPVTSKTAAEIQGLVDGLGLRTPFVAENGCVVRVPEGYFAEPVPERMPGCPDRASIVAHLAALRSERGFDFEGFTDMGVARIAQLTGLSEAQARLADQRSASEPLVWHDSPERLEALVALLEPLGLRVTRGGRFVHVLGDSDKGRAAHSLLERLKQAHPEDSWLSVALGDAPNDLPMLDAVDIAVVIPSPKGFALEPKAERVLRPDGHGPVGWGAAVTQLLDEYGG